MRISLLLLELLLAIPLVADSELTGISGPLLGYITRASKIAPIVGIPASSYVAVGLDVGDLRVLGLSSAQQYAVVRTADEKSVRLYSLRPGAALQDRIIVEFQPNIDSVAISPTGTSVAMLRASEGLLDIFTGLPQEAVVKSIPFSSTPRAIAISDDGAALAVVEGNTISLIDAAGKHQLAASESIRDIGFRPNSHDLVYVDGSAAQVILWTDSANVVAGPADGLSAPSRALFSTDGPWIFITDTAARELLITSPVSNQPQRVTLPCPPYDLEALKESVLRFTCEADASVHLVQVKPDGVRVLFVPESVE